MILIGDTLIPYESFFKIQAIEDIPHTKANSIVLFSYNEELMKYCSENKIFYAVKIQSIKEAIYANALHARYIICKHKKAKTVQKIAQNYLFDSKILAIITSNDKLKNIAYDKIDGVIYKSILE